MDTASYFLNGLTTNVGIYLRKSASTKLINVQGGVVSLQPIDVNVDGMMDLILTGSTTTILLGDGDQLEPDAGCLEGRDTQFLRQTVE